MDWDLHPKRDGMADERLRDVLRPLDNYDPITERTASNPH